MFRSKTLSLIILKREIHSFTTGQQIYQSCQTRFGHVRHSVFVRTRHRRQQRVRRLGATRLYRPRHAARAESAEERSQSIALAQRSLLLNCNQDRVD